jgi:hypothetical protein
MSLILDALNRSESDRADPESAPGLQSVHGPRAQLSATPWRRMLWPLLTLALALLAAGLWFSSEPAVEGPSVASPGEPVQEVTQADAPIRQEVEQEVEVVPVPASAVEPAPTAPSLEADVAALYGQTPPGDQSPAVKDTAPMQAEAPAASEPAPSEPELDIDALTRAAEAQLADINAGREPVVEHSAPFISDLRQLVKDQIPSIFYSEHNWATKPAERSVVLNRQRFGEGQQVKPGLRLVEILPDSIVLEFQGTEFRLQSLNSWVNL